MNVSEAISETRVLREFSSQKRANREGKILVLTSSFPRFAEDAAAPYLLEFYRHVRERRGGEVTVLFPSDTEDDRLWEEDGIRRCRFDYLPKKNWQTLAFGSGIPDNLFGRPSRLFQIPFFLWSFYRKALRLSREADLIHAHWILPSGLIGALLKRKNPQLKLVLTVHSSDLWLIERLPLGRFLLRWILAVTDHLTLVSRRQGARIEKLLSDSLPRLRGRISLLPMGIHWGKYQDENRAERKKALGLDGRTVILYLGRLIPLKGVAYLLDAVKSMKEVTVVILGEGLERNRLESLSRKIPFVRFLGSLQGEEKRGWLSLADIAVFPSISLGRRHEGLPVALLEAMASGLAVVATDTGGIGEAIRHGETGLLVPEKDSKALQESLEYLASDPQFRRSLGERAREASRRYDWGRVGQAFLEIYEELLQ
jgi:glycosyltransferase involved in cell wall biosynthesis